MKFYKCLKHALNMVVHSKLRSWLTIIGIVSMGDGMQKSMEDQMQS